VKSVLSISGGGIRGLIPCLHLVELEKQLGKLTREVVSFCGGTSTGALLTACIAAGVPASEALKVYTEQGSKVFSPTNTLERDALMVSRGYKFDNKILFKTVFNTLGKKAAMNINSSPIPILITACDMNGRPYYFTRDEPTNARCSGLATLVDAAVASACANTYHQCWNVPGWGYFFDGGVAGMADPVEVVCVEAFSGVGCYGSIDPEDVVVISLGTGVFNADKPIPPPNGLLEQITFATSSLVGSGRTLAAQSTDRHWPGVRKAFNVLLPKEIDEADVNSIPLLVELGTQAAACVDWKTVLGL
jgi:predicted acylesterase/phospholipase RssA